MQEDILCYPYSAVTEVNALVFICAHVHIPNSFPYCVSNPHLNIHNIYIFLKLDLGWQII